MANIIFVKNEHPLEATSNLIADKLAAHLKEQGYDIEHPTKISHRVSPVETNGHLDLEKTFRRLDKQNEGRAIAKKNPDKLIISFHATPNRTNDREATKRFLKNPEIPEWEYEGKTPEQKFGEQSYEEKVFYGKDPKCPNLIYLEVRSPATHAGWKKGYGKYSPEKIRWGTPKDKKIYEKLYGPGKGNNDPHHNMPEEAFNTGVHNVTLAKKHDVVLTPKFIKALGKGVVGLAKTKGYVPKRRRHR